MNKRLNLLSPLALVILGTWVSCAGMKTPAGSGKDGSAGELNRRTLPIAEPAPEKITEIDARKAKAPQRFSVTAPTGAPNVLVILIDDLGFGHSDTFGGPISMPTLNALATNGLKYNRFHTTALCSPTRMALLTGRNHHVTNTGAVMEIATAFPGNTGVRPNSVTPLAEILRQNGFSTAAFGKYHETAPWEVSVSGPFDRWPTRSGFDKFYGFIGGEANQWAPGLFDGVIRVEPSSDPNYHLTVDLADQAVAWVKAQQTLTPDRPFFMYFATGATHAPHHVPKQWADKYKGKFDQGWDKLREETFARQKQLGVIPQDTVLTPRPKEIPAWDSFSAEQRKLFTRQMEVFAGFAEHTDHQISRLVQALKELGELDNTLIFYIAGDNGSSAEGGLEGTVNEMMALNGIQGKASQMLGKIEQWGGPETFPHFAVGWAWAGNTPFQWTKQVASHFGGTRNGMVIHWPERIKADGAMRSQFQHVVDIAPTILEATNVPMPDSVNGIVQRPMDGVSLIHTFAKPDAEERHKTQYFEMFGNRAIYHDGWVAATRHSTPWDAHAPLPALPDDVWELYHVEKDFSQSQNLAAQEPKKLKELQELFEKEAVKNHVYPIDDRRVERFNPALAGRPDLMGERTSLTVYPGMTGIMENAFINVKGRAHDITADVELRDSRTNGVIIAQAGRFGGWSLFMKNGKLKFEYNFFSLERTQLTSTKAIPAGKHQIRYQFRPNSPKPGDGGKAALYVDDQLVAEGEIARTQPFAFSGDEGADVGLDGETPVSNDYAQGNNRFTGKISQVVIELKTAAQEAAAK